MKLLVCATLCMAASCASAADGILGKYISGAAAEPAILEIKSLQGDVVTASFYLPAKKRNGVPCSGEHELTGTFAHGDLSLRDAPGASVVPGCEQKFDMQTTDDGFKGLHGDIHVHYHREQ